MYVEMYIEIFCNVKTQDMYLCDWYYKKLDQKWASVNDRFSSIQGDQILNLISS